MHALILVGGRGERLRPLTDTTPKPLLPLGERISTLELLVRKCVAEGFPRITFAMRYRAEDIMSALGAGTQYGAAFRYCVEQRPLGTAGPIRWMHRVKDPFLVLNGDTMFSFSLRSLYDAHRTTPDVWMTIATQEYTYTIPYGIIELGRLEEVAEIQEKPTFVHDIVLGAYVCSPHVCTVIAPDEAIDIPALVHRIWAKNHGMAIQRLRTWSVGEDQDWHDIGTPASYKAASNAFLANPTRYGGSLCPQY